ncbi:MAG: ATP-binding protein [Oscillospiraceae bacterium]|nr:ATP-binding protein [Oscillospiraceae bacterium]
MKKLINYRYIWIIVPCVLALFTALYFFIRNGQGSDELVNYFVVLVVLIILIAVVSIIIAGIISRKVTQEIISSVEAIGFNKDGAVVFEELLPYKNKITRERQELFKKNEELKVRADTIETITGNMQEGLVLIDNKGTVLSANNSAGRVLGDNTERKNILHICREDEFQTAVKSCMNGENTRIQMNRSGKIYSVFFSPVSFGGNMRGAVILFQDTTESHRAEMQRREFSANVSHELKTPLTTITALSEMIATGMVQEEDIKNFAGKVNEQSGRLLTLIDDIIRLSEFDEGRENKEDTAFNLKELAEAVINSLRDNVKNVEINLIGESFNIYANRRMIDELLYNLIDNGIKYNADNGKVTVELQLVYNSLCKISVSDTGIGISQEHHPHIFERFYRVDKSRSKLTGGTGLGLSIVKHITEYYKGSLELISNEGDGTTVTCYLKC